jgi:RNAse (barnase) inhibitor barstar
MAEAPPPPDRAALGRSLLAYSAVTLYYRMPLLERTVAALLDAGYHVVRADASGWLSVRDMHGGLSRMLHLPGYYGENMQALNECLHDVIAHEYGLPASATGLVFVLTGFDAFSREFPQQAQGLLDVIATRSRGALIQGQHVICLPQSDDPRLALPAVGATPVYWNHQEWLNASRGV